MFYLCMFVNSNYQGPVARSMVSANHWLNSIKTNRFLWPLTLVSANHPSSNSAQSDLVVDPLRIKSILIETGEFIFYFLR